MNVKVLKWFLWLGYIPLLACLIPVVLKTRHQIMEPAEKPSFWNRHPENKYGRITFFYLPLYLMLLFYPLFHLLVSVRIRFWTIVLLQIVSQLFSLTAGCSIVSVSFNTDGLKLDNHNDDSMIIGTIILIVIQFYSYVLWFVFLLKDLSHHECRSLCLPSAIDRSKREILKTGGRILVAMCGVVGFLLYIVSIIVNWAKYNYTIYEVTCANFSNFCKVIQLLPSALFLMMSLMVALFICCKKKIMLLIISSLTSLLSLFLGYSNYAVLLTLNLPIPIVPHTCLFKLQLAGGSLLTIVTYLMNVGWSITFYGLMRPERALGSTYATLTQRTDEEQLLLQKSSDTP